MSGIINKVKDALSKDDKAHDTTATTNPTHTTAGTAHTGATTAGSTNAGPHTSNLANKTDPRVDSDLGELNSTHQCICIFGCTD